MTHHRLNIYSGSQDGGYIFITLMISTYVATARRNSYVAHFVTTSPTDTKLPIHEYVDVHTFLAKE